MALSITKDSFNREQATEKAASAVVKLQEMQLGRKAGTLLMITSVMLLGSNLIADLILGWLDPRIVYS